MLGSCATVGRMLLRSVAVVVLASGAAAAQAPPVPGAVEAPVRITEITRADGTHQIWEVARDRLSKVPRWDFTTAQAPLSLVAAVSIAEKWAAQQNPDATRWQVVSAVLTPIVTPMAGRASGVTLSSWYYRVQLATAIDSPSVLIPGPVGDARRVSVVVLLDGSVVEPRNATAPGATQATSARPQLAPQAVPQGLRLAPGTSDVYLAWPGTGVVAPQPKNRPVPKYTAEAIRRGIQGNVRLQCVVDTDGRCRDIAITQSLDSVYGLDEQAINTAREYRFTPGTLNGKPVRVRIDLEFSFNVK